MFTPPTADQVREVAEALRLRVDDGEIELYRDRVATQLGHHRDFLSARLDAIAPPLLASSRGPGHRPDPDSDPYRAWMWRCEIRAEAPGPLADRRVGVKDHVSVAGVPQAFNSRALEGFVPDFDATVVTRVLSAGGVICGKLAMNGFMDEYAMPLNPHDLSRTPGGSSSGSAVAVAAGDVDVAIGGDQGGSIRIPAAYCGVVGLKPTFGLVSHFGISYGFEPSLDHVGPMARRVEDVALALDVMAGYDGLDPRQDREVPMVIDTSDGLMDGVRGIRIGVVDESFDDPIDAGVASAVAEAMQVLRAAGAIVSRVSIPQHRDFDDVYAALAIDGTRAVFDTGPFGTGHRGYYPSASIAAVNRMWSEQADRLPPRIKVNHIVAEFSRKAYGGAIYAKAQNVRRSFRQAYDDALDQVDLLVMPTVRTTAPARSGPTGDPLADLAHRLDDSNWMYLDSAYNTKPLNYTGHPALAVPCGKVDGLPVSMQLVGRHFDDATLLRTAFVYQEAVDWEALTAVAARTDGREP